jgi:hypothetical protein
MAANGRSTIKVAGIGRAQWQQMALALENMCLGARQQLALARQATIKRGQKMSPKTNHGAPRRNEWKGENIRPRLLPMVI